jgi:hypothetical protein
MKNPNVYRLFAITGLLIFVISLFPFEFPVINIHDTYFVIEPMLLGVSSLAVYTVLSAIYFLCRNYANNRIGLAQYFFTTIPFLYFVFSEYLTNDNYMLCFQEDFVSKFLCNLPLILLMLFAFGLILFPINLLIAAVKRFR